MYFDDSHSEVKVTDVTHCDLETKSILKPPKARAPLQEVDLGNHITVDFDVIRKRRVSFAGVNKIKEFNSEAKSFSICNTPAYEEKVSTSSDSSAFSTSVSGNINSLTKENDLTILDDTMDLTDLSIVQQSAMDITGIKPQKPMQGVPDIFAPRSQDSGLFGSQQEISRPILSCLNVEVDLGPNPLPAKSEKLNEPEGTPLALDPRKMLLNELLEESTVDCSVDNYLKANILFAANACNVVRESKCEIKKSLEVTEMDCTQALGDPIKPELHNVHPVLEKKYSASEQIHTKIISSNPTNLFGCIDIGIEGNDRLQQNVLGMGYPKHTQRPNQSHMFSNFNSDDSRSTKIDASQMDFTEALPPKNFNLAQKNSVASGYINDRLLAKQHHLNPTQNMMPGHVNVNTNHNSNISLMEFTEALPSKNIFCQNLVENIQSTTAHPLIQEAKPLETLLPNPTVSIFNTDSPRIGYNNLSQMEFTEVLPSKNIGHKHLVSNNHPNSSVSQMEHPKHFASLVPVHTVPYFNVDETRLRNSNMSQMEFTEALPSKNFVHQHLVANNYSSSSVSPMEQPKHFGTSMPGHPIPHFNVDETRERNSNASQMEFTEALPSKNIGQQPSVANNHSISTVSQMEHKKHFALSVPLHAVPHFNVDETRTRNSNMSQMELTEALPSKNIGLPHLVSNNHSSSSVSQTEHTKHCSPSIPHFNVDETRARNSNTSQMEITEALPSNKIRCQNSVVSQHPEHYPMSIPNHLAPHFNIDESMARNVSMSTMEFTEALPSKNIAPSNFNFDRSRQANSTNATQMELTEALPSQNLDRDRVVANNYVKDIQEKSNNSRQIPLKPCSNMIVSNSVEQKLDEKPDSLHRIHEDPSLHDIQSSMFPNSNTEVSRTNKIDSTEALPSLDIDSAHKIVTNNMIGKPNIAQVVHPIPLQNTVIDKFISSDSNNASQMEFTEALPSKMLPYNNISAYAENRLLANSNIPKKGVPKINSNPEELHSINLAENYIVSFTEKVETSQMELTEALPMLKINKRQSTNVAGYSSGFPRNSSRKSVIVDRENIPPSQDLNDSNSMDITEMNSTDSENVMYDIKSESNVNVNIKTTATIDESKQNVCENYEMTKKHPFVVSAIDNIIDNSSCVKSTSSTASLKEHDNKNVPLETKGEIPDKLNVSNTMDITNIDQQDIVRNLKENENAEVYNINKLIMQPTLNLEESISKDMSQMEFTEAIPARNIKATLNPAAQQTNSDCENSNKTKLSPNYNLQTSNMEFTEVLPMKNLKQVPINQNLNDSCSMDVTHVENVSNLDTSQNLKGSSEIPDNKVNIKPTSCSDNIELEIEEKISDENYKNSTKFPVLSSSQNNFVTERTKTDFSQLEFTEALPVNNKLDAVKMATDVSNGNDLLCSSSMEFTEFLQKPDNQHFIFASENIDEERKKNETHNYATLPAKKANVDNLCSDGLTAGTNKHALIENSDEMCAQGSSVNQVLNIQKSDLIDKPQMESIDKIEKNFNLQSKPFEHIFPESNQLSNSSVYTTQMDFTEAVQPPQLQRTRDNTQQHKNNEVVLCGKSSGKFISSEIDENKIPDASQMEFTEAITMPKDEINLFQKFKDSIDNNVVNDLVEDYNKSSCLSKEVIQPNIENKSDKEKSIFSNENESEMLISINENLEKDIDHIKKSDNLSKPKHYEDKLINNISTEECQNNKMKDNSDRISSHTMSNKDNRSEFGNSKQVKNESVSSTQNFDLSPMNVDEPFISTVERKDNKVSSLRKLFENESQLNNVAADINTPKGKQFPMARSTGGSSCEISSNSKSASAVTSLTIDVASQKKNLVHFNTPPVRIIKRRKTVGFPNPEESVQLLQSNTTDLALPLQDVSTAALGHQNSSQRGIFDEEKKLGYNLEKGEEEWNRLVKNDAFMKERSFHFVNPCKWKYQFRWPMEILLEIPDIEVNENTRRKNITLVSNISDSDHISVFIHNRMRKNMSVILSENWLHSHCKTIKDLLFAIKFIEEEYNKLEPLISSMKYFYQEFPFDFSSDRIIFKIVNLRREYCFEVKIDVSYGQVKGKNIDVINHVGEISKTKVQQLFDQLQPNTERFYLFWQKLSEIHEI